MLPTSIPENPSNMRHTGKTHNQYPDASQETVISIRPPANGLTVKSEEVCTLFSKSDN